MTAKLLLRISAILIFVHLLGHAGGHMGWDKPKDPKMMEVVTAMKGYSAEFMGATKSMADYFHGYSLFLFGLYAMSIALLWVLSGYAAQHPKLVKQLIYPIGLAYLLFGIIEFIYFFPFAAIISLLAGLSAIFATLKLAGK